MKVQPPIFLVEDRTPYTDSQLRQAEIDQHVAEFLRKGGKVQSWALTLPATTAAVSKPKPL